MLKTTLQAGKLCVNPGDPLLVIAGVCVLEDEVLALSVAKTVKQICQKHSLPFIFKGSFDKANRSSLKSYRGPGIREGLRILERVKKEVDVPVLTDIHSPDQADPVAEVVDVLQVPAFLCRQTDLLLAAAQTGKPVNVKKAQFLGPWEMINVIEKIRSAGNQQILVTERGSSFGYNNLVVDFRSIPILGSMGCLVVLDVTHCLQRPGGLGDRTGGNPEFIPTIARAGVAAGAQSVFIETHPSPEDALSDGPNCLPLSNFEALMQSLVEFDAIRRKIVSIE